MTFSLRPSLFSRSSTSSHPLLLFAICYLLFAISPGCSRSDLSGPPNLRVGRDECGECGMLVAEERSSCAILVERGGRREYVMFDDIGCLLDYPGSRGGDYTLIDTFVRDYGTGEWINANEAWFLVAHYNKLLTPMGSGLAAFTTEARAKEGQQKYEGQILRFDGMAAARQEWLTSRFGSP